MTDEERESVVADVRRNAEPFIENLCALSLNLLESFTHLSEVIAAIHNTAHFWCPGCHTRNAADHKPTCKVGAAVRFVEQLEIERIAGKGKA